MLWFPVINNIRVIIFRISSTATSSEGEVAGMLTEAAVPHRSWSLSVRQMPPGWATWATGWSRSPQKKPGWMNSQLTLACRKRRTEVQDWGFPYFWVVIWLLSGIHTPASGCKVGLGTAFCKNTEHLCKWREVWPRRTCCGRPVWCVSNLMAFWSERSGIAR